MTSHHPTHPPLVLLEWVKLAIAYEHAGLGNSMTEQTRYALMGVRDFLSQPAEAYCSEHYEPCKHHADPEDGACG